MRASERGGGTHAFKGSAPGLIPGLMRVRRGSQEAPQAIHPRIPPSRRMHTGARESERTHLDARQDDPLVLGDLRACGRHQPQAPHAHVRRTRDSTRDAPAASRQPKQREMAVPNGWVPSNERRPGAVAPAGSQATRDGYAQQQRVIVDSALPRGETATPARPMQETSAYKRPSRRYTSKAPT